MMIAAYRLVLLYFLVFISDSFADSSESESLTFQSELQHNHDQLEIVKNYVTKKHFFSTACDRVAAFPFDKFPIDTPRNQQLLSLTVRYALLEEAFEEYSVALKYNAQNEKKLSLFSILMDKISSWKLSEEHLVNLAALVDQYKTEEITLDDYRLKFKNMLLSQLKADEEECKDSNSEGHLSD